MDTFTISEVKTSLDEALMGVDCAADIDAWLDDTCMDATVPSFVWSAVNALRKYAESLED